MSQKLTAIATIAAAAFATIAFAQSRPHDQVMKDVASTFATLKTKLDANDSTAAEEAAKLEGLFKETESFWLRFATKDAVDAAKAGGTAASKVQAALRENSGQKAALAAYGGIGKACKTCHDSHREQLPDKSYKIKP